MFDLFDPTAEVSIRHGNLPHWNQAGVTYFVTFRTADSVPRSLVSDWHSRRMAWLRQHGIDADCQNWQEALARDTQLQRGYHKRFTSEFLAYLDRGLGECLLRRGKLRSIVSDALRFFDSQRYIMDCFVVMPNHVHLLVGLLGQTEIEKQCRSWKRYSAREINRVAERNGRFWQSESFDHLVRTPEQFEFFRRYIEENPRNASLPPDEFTYWQRPAQQATCVK